MKRTFVVVALLLLATPAAADMVYKPVNPSFGGDPFNSSHLTGLASSQNLQTPSSSSNTTQTAGKRFLSMLQSRLYSSLASQVSEAIFGENAKQSGSVTFDDQQVEFVNTGSEIQIKITDFLTGEVTNIAVPTLVTE
ncbi:MAG: curli assembly protein CsgF [Alphaproteobacteria bacterium]